MKKVFICSSCWKDIEDNIKRVKYYTSIIAGTNRMLTVPYYYFTSFFNNNNFNERVTDTEMSLKQIKIYDKVYVFGSDNMKRLKFELGHIGKRKEKIILYGDGFQEANLRILKGNKSVIGKYYRAISG